MSELSIDPGRTTGLVLWLNRKPVPHCQIKVPDKMTGNLAKFAWLHDQVQLQVQTWIADYEPIRQAAVERPHTWNMKGGDKWAMQDGVLTNMQYQTAIILALTSLGIPVVEVKRNASKERFSGRSLKGKEGPKLVARSYGFHGPTALREHEQDALYIGALAGYGTQ